jgi:hypothetical protein
MEFPLSEERDERGRERARRYDAAATIAATRSGREVMIGGSIMPSSD